MNEKLKEKESSYSERMKEKEEAIGSKSGLVSEANKKIKELQMDVK